MREYELNVIVQPEISSEGTQAIFARLDTALENAGAVRLMNEDLGKRKLAYEIAKFQKGHYYLFSFLDDGGSVPELERLLRMEESVLRFLTVKIADSVDDVEGRRAAAAEAEKEQERRLAEKAAREAEEAAARAAAEEASRKEAEEAARKEAEETARKEAEEAVAASEAGEADAGEAKPAEGEPTDAAAAGEEEKSQ